MDASIIAGLGVGALVSGTVYAALALGYNITYRASKSLNLAHPGVALLTAYLAFALTSRLGLNLAEAIAAAAALGFAAGVALERLIARPLLGQPPASLIAATLGAYFVFRGASMLVAGSGWSGGSLPLPWGPVRIGGVVLDPGSAAALLLAGASVAAVVVFHRFTRLGVAMRAVSEDAYGAAAYGIPVRRITMLSWGLAGLVGALAAAALALENNVTPTLDYYVFNALAASLIAGLDSVAGVVAGGLLLGLVEQYAGYLLSPWLPGFYEAAAYIVMLAVLFVKPYGIFGTERIERV